MKTNPESPSHGRRAPPTRSRERRFADRLHRSETNLVELFDVTTDGILVHRDLRYVYANSAALKILGRDSAEVVGHSPFELVPPRFRLLLAEQIMQAYTKRSALPEVEERLLHASGAEVPVEVVTIPILFDGELSTLTHIRDISRRRALEVRLRATDRLTSAGLIATGIVHEIERPLNYALSTLKRLEARLDQRYQGSDREVDWMLDTIIDGVDRAVRAARNVGVFSQVHRFRPARVDIHHVLDSAVTFLDPDLRSRVNIVKRYGHVPPVLGNESRVAQIFLHLITNAAQSMGERLRGPRDITLRTEATGAFVKIEVEDTGMGISAELQSTIFEPLFTTRAQDSGFGLALCRELVAEEEGELSVASVIGKGTTFTILLRAASHLLTADEHEAHERCSGRRILVVDDEPLLAETLRMMLASHHMTLAKSGHEALQHLHAGEQFDLVLCDLLMERIDGIELYRHIATTWPDLARRMIFLTGDAFISRTQEFLASIPNRHLQKPFHPEELLDLIDDLIERRLAEPNVIAASP